MNALRTAPVRHGADRRVSRLFGAAVCAMALVGTVAPPARATTFSTGVEYPVGPHPSHLAMGELNGDGVPDLVVANNGVRLDGSDAPGHNTVSVLIGTGGGTFAPAVSYVVGDNAAFVAVADLDGDASADVVVTSLGSQVLSVLLGNGDGTFAPSTAYNAGPAPRGVATGDFDNDGDADVAVANRDAGVSVLVGNGDGTLAPAVSYSTAGSGPALVVVTELDGDGRPDLAVTNQVSSTVAVLLGNGNGTFAPAVTYPAGGGSFGLATGYLNADAHLDLVTSDYIGDGISVLLGNGDGTLQSPVAYPVGSSPFSVDTADLNGDGKLDVVAANEGSHTNSYVSVFLGRGDGTLSPGVQLPTPPGPKVIAGDLNGDGRPDLATANRQADSVSVLLNQARAATTTSVASSATSSTYGEPVTFTATVSGSDIEGHTPGGSVTFYAGATVLGTSGLSAGTAALTTSALGGGSHAITAVYEGDPHFLPGTSATLSHTVGQATSSTSVSSSPNPSSTGDAVTFTAAVHAGGSGAAAPTGTVTFMDGTAPLGTATLSSGTATVSTTSLTAGDHAITAVYGGDANYSSSTSPVLTQSVANRLPATREDCLDDGWRTLTDDAGNPFPNQGACVSFVSRTP